MHIDSEKVSIKFFTLANIYFRRDGTLNTMPDWIYQVFIRFLPRVLFMEPPEDDQASENEDSTISGMFGSRKE